MLSTDSKQRLKRIPGWLGLFLAGVLLGVVLARWWLKATPQPQNGVASARGAVTITLSATIDGSDRFVFAHDRAYNEHGIWRPPQHVIFNDKPWEDLSESPPGWAELARDLDLAKATIVNRTGRDLIVLESTPDGFDLYFADTPMGAGQYDVTISIPKMPN